MKIKILHFFLVLNFLFAAIGGMTFGIVANASSSMFSAGLIGAAVAIVGLSILISRRCCISLQSIENSVATAQGGHPSQIEELEATRLRLRQYVQRWSVAAKRSREQNRTIDWLVETLERRSGTRDTDGSADAGHRLREIITGIKRDADACLDQIVDAVTQVQSAVGGISAITLSQSTEVTKSTSHVEHLSQSMAAISAAAVKAQESGMAVSSSLNDLSTEMQERVASIRRIQAGVESGESRLRAMLDHVGEIGAIANSIADISSRTDMLALNLSIESARTNGGTRGSSNVAEEVRRLAEKTANAAHEVAGLVESIQIDTQESIATIAQQNTDLTTELSHSHAASERITIAARNASNTATHLKAIGKASAGQIRLSTELVKFVESISTLARENREQSEAAVWNAGSLATASAQFDKLLAPLREVSLPDTSAATLDVQDLTGTNDAMNEPHVDASLAPTL